MKVQLDSEGYFTGNYALIGDIENSTEVESLPPYEDGLKQQSCKYVDNNWVFDEDKYAALQEEDKKQEESRQKILEILKLEKELQDTDYKVIKCQECSLLGLDLPYDIESVHAERQAIRDKINELQAE